MIMKGTLAEVTKEEEGEEGEEGEERKQEEEERVVEVVSDLVEESRTVLQKPLD